MKAGISKKTKAHSSTLCGEDSRVLRWLHRRCCLSMRSQDVTPFRFWLGTARKQHRQCSKTITNCWLILATENSLMGSFNQEKSLFVRYMTVQRMTLIRPGSHFAKDQVPHKDSQPPAMVPCSMSPLPSFGMVTNTLSTSTLT